MDAPPYLDPAQIVARYDAVFLDAYGVLNDHAGPRPGAAEFLARLHAAGRPWCVVSNDASRSAEAAAARYARFGLPIPAERIVLSGAVLASYFATAGLVGAPCFVLGPDDSRAWVREAGGIVLDDPDPGADARAVVVCDDEGYDFFPAVEAAIAIVIARREAGERVDLVLPNPDLVFPKGTGRLGLTAGAVALVIEAALALRFADDPPRFARLGKPHPMIFAVAMQRLGLPPGTRIAMIGDQLHTDVAGALAAGFDAVLVGGGVTDLDALDPDGPRPTWRLHALG